VNLKVDQTPEISLESWIRDSNWENLRKGEGRLFKENVEVLLNLREKYLDQKTSANQRELISKAFVSMVDKTFSHEMSREIMRGIAPEISKNVPLTFKSLRVSFEIGRER
jgi:hypothetical protein